MIPEMPHTETNHNVDSDLDYYQQWQINRFGNIVTSAGELLTKEEAERQEQEREAERLDRYFENMLNDHWNY